MRRSLRLFYYFNLLAVTLLVVYKIYLNFFERDFEAVHAAQVERIEERLQGRTSFSFAVVGNINNSVGIFERKIVPMLNRSGVDFVVSAGNAVSAGGEDKYRALSRTLKRLEMPYLLTFGENEYSRLGSFRFYDHYGPYLYAFSAGNSHFIFLDSTGKTSYVWQLRWIEEELAADSQEHTFLFSGHPVIPVDRKGLLGLDDDYLVDRNFASQLISLAERHTVDAVFSANLPLFSRERQGGTEYVITGGAGGLVLNNERSYYHYVQVTVDGDRVELAPVRLEIGQHPALRTLESLWFFIHSLFYVGYLNFLLLVSALIVAAIWLHRAIFVERDYYPNVNLDLEPHLRRQLRIAMFTNNFLPFVGGVPISIDRLRRGLKGLGHEVLIVAPAYWDSVEEEEEKTLRVGSLLPGRQKAEFRLANIFSPRIYREVASFRPHLIHVHHPFWLGTVGLWLARRLDVPVIYTYHTRLEHYAHYVPLPGPLFRNLIAHALVRRFANRCQGVVVPTESAEEYLRVIGVRSPLFVQPTGIEYERFANVDADEVDRLRSHLGIGQEKVLISVSRLSQEKNIDFMLEAIRDLVQRCPTAFRLLIIGGGPERDRLQSRIADLGLENRVLLTGAVPPSQVPVYCHLGDVFVFASRSETQGMVILEAMAAGLPVVAVRSSGINDFVRDGVNGFLTPPSRERWAEQVERLLADRQLRERLATNAREFARAHDVKSFALATVHIYAHLLAAHSHRHSARLAKES